MISLRFDILASVVGGTIYNNEKADKVFIGVSIDSRTVRQGELFVAIHGEQNDGHDHIPQALERGAAGIVAEYQFPGLQMISGQVPVVAVDNSHQAMMTLAEEYRSQLNCRIAAITGSNGKTTTKELAYSLIAAVEPKAYRSPGNLNNLFGVPLALFGVPNDSTVAVFELGISTELEMPQLAEMVKPHLVLITNVGPSHLEFLTSVEAVAHAKLELVRGSNVDMPVIVNADDKVLLHEARKICNDLITYALDAEAQYRPDRIEELGFEGTAVTIEDNTFYLPLHGRYQVSNLLAAYTLARTMGYNLDKIDTTAIKLTTAPMRGQRVIIDGITFISDCYNANPVSMRAGIESFLALPFDGRRILILGDMLELGSSAIKFHRDIGKFLAEQEVDRVVLVGDLTQYIREAAVAGGMSSDRFSHYNSASSCAEEMKKELKASDVVYVKGSRGIGLEAVLVVFEQEGDN